MFDTDGYPVTKKYADTLKESKKQMDKEERNIIRDPIKTCIGTVVFFVIGILLFCAAQAVLTPKRFPYVKSYDAGKVSGFYTEKNNSIDVLICSTSHASKGILPMEMYEEYGIKSYNLATSIQPVEATYYLLNEALNTQQPKVFIYDVSSLYIGDVEKSYWWYVLDEMRMGKSKYALAQEYQKSAKNRDESTRELLIPFLRYHTRWKELSTQDFTACLKSRHDYGKGGQINAVMADTGVSVEQMNAAADELLKNTQKEEYVYNGGEVLVKREEDILYHADIPEKNIEWLKRIKALCDENGIEFLAVKVPAAYLPQSYHSAWTQDKYDAVRSLCDECGISYYDLLYDADIGIDWSCDVIDRGEHLNLYGAQKVSLELGRYLKEHYELPQGHDEQWDRDLLCYKEVRDVVQLELQTDFTEYINMLAEKHSDKVIFICVSGDLAAGLEEENRNALRALGLQTDFTAASQKAYIAVVENGKVKYEALSDRQLSYSGVCGESKEAYDLFSSGWWTSAEASIRLAGSELVNSGNEGINIAVYDDEKALVIDCVCFDMSTEERKAVRNNAEIIGFETAFERFVTERENR